MESRISAALFQLEVSRTQICRALREIHLELGMTEEEILSAQKELLWMLEAEIEATKRILTSRKTD